MQDSIVIVFRVKYIFHKIIYLEFRLPIRKQRLPANIYGKLGLLSFRDRSPCNLISFLPKLSPVEILFANNSEREDGLHWLAGPANSISSGFLGRVGKNGVEPDVVTGSPGLLLENA